MFVLVEALIWLWCGNRCSTSQSGDLIASDKALDGIFGFGQQGLSVISQLSSLGITPKVFSHCLKGEGEGGGILVLGEILDASIVYSPLIPSQYVFFTELEYFLLLVILNWKGAYIEYHSMIFFYLEHFLSLNYNGSCCLKFLFIYRIIQARSLPSFWTILIPCSWKVLMWEILFNLHQRVWLYYISQNFLWESSHVNMYAY